MASIYRRLLLLLFVRMFYSSSGDVVKAVISTNHSLAIFSTLQPTQSDAQFLAIPPIAEPYKVFYFIAISSPSFIGAHDGSIQPPPDVVSQTVCHNRFLLMRRSLVPRRQNLRFGAGAMACLWGQGDLIHGQIIEGRRFQVVSPSEETMEMVVRRGHWAFVERVVVLQRWDLSMKQRPPRKPPWNQHITEDIGDAIGMRIRRSNQQHIWVYDTITKTYIFSSGEFQYLWSCDVTDGSQTLTFESIKVGSSIKRRCFPS